MLRFLVGLLAGLSVVMACYSERLPPPNFRYGCTQDSDCSDPQRCIDNLCQIPCTQATFSTACGQNGGFAFCLNGVCSSTCLQSDDNCPGRQRCLSPGFNLGSLIGGGGGFGGGGGVDTEDLGICGMECTPSSCPEGEACFAGFCVATCEPDGPDTCPSGFVCAGGLCVPGTGEDPTATDTATATEGDTITATDTATATGGETLTATGGETLTASGGDTLPTTGVSP